MDNNNTNHSSNSNVETSSSHYLPQQYMIIDVRSYEETVLSGGGNLPRAIQLEPTFLDQPQAFDVWIQHFDGTRGINICIVDLPPTQWTGIALWRRLLLGEGDGQSQNNGSNYARRYVNNLNFDDPNENLRRLDALLAGKRFVTDGKSIADMITNTGELHCDERSKYYQEEIDARAADLHRPAVLLAIALQTHAFPNVCVLEGGFPALVNQLILTRGTVEPIIINHEEDKWKEFLKSTGRSQDPLLNHKTKKLSLISTLTNSFNSAGTSITSESEKTMMKREKDFSESERLEIAIDMAEKLQHPTMLSILRNKLSQISGSG
jgi:hypothetical protein